MQNKLLPKIQLIHKPIANCGHVSLLQRLDCLLLITVKMVDLTLLNGDTKKDLARCFCASVHEENKGLTIFIN